MGDCLIPESEEVDWIKKAKTAAWRQQKGRDQRTAKETFLLLLRRVGPEWDV